MKINNINKQYGLLALATCLIIAVVYYEIPQNHYERYKIRQARNEIEKEGVILYQHEKDDIQKRRLNKAKNTKGSDAYFEPQVIKGVMSHQQRLFHKLDYKIYQNVDYVIDREVKSIKKTLFRQLGESGAALTVENTEPLKIKYNWVNFDKDKSPPFRQCFEAGAWYYRGGHKVTSPPSGSSYKACLDPNKPDADPNANYLGDTDCWGKCEAGWVLTPDVIEYVKTSIEKSLEELESTLRVPKINGRLKFEKGTGSYIQLYEELGYSKEDILTERCFADGYFFNTPFEDSWCTDGLEEGYNYVLSITNTPPFNNDGSGGGTGGVTLRDTYNRPLAGTYNLLLSIGKWYEDSIGKPADYGPKAFRILSIHEALHALGWNIGDLQLANAVAGPFKSYTEPGEKGVSDDALWYVKPSTRSATLAKVHFDCQDESKWRGYPLMGIIENGRDSHHNSHIFWEDVESYGIGGLITPITLALMEDLGVYLADYTKSTLPNLGAWAGCDFVNTRCRHQDENGITDQTYETVASTEECEGWVNKWNGGGMKSYLVNQDFRLNKCNNDYRTKCGSVNKCHPECIIKTADNGKEYNKWRPLGNATGALPAIYPTKTEQLKKTVADSMLLYLLPLLVSILFSFVLGIIYRTCHSLFASEKKMVCWSHLISSLFAAFGIAIIATAIYVIVNTDVYGHFLSSGAAGAFAAFGVIILLFGVVQYKTAKTTHLLSIFTVGLVSSVVLIAQLAVVAYLLYFVNSFDAVDNAEVGTSDYERWESHGAMGDNLKSMESYICRSYQTCCRDPILLVGGTTDTEVDAEGSSNSSNSSSIAIHASNVTIENTQTCVTPHPGMSEQELSLLKLKDPSNAGFCEMVTGTKNKYFTSMSEGACQKLDEEVIDFNRTSCQVNFCKAGIGGYNNFVTTMIAMARRNMYSFAMMCFALAFVQLFQLILLIKLYRYHKVHTHSQTEMVQTKDVKVVTTKKEDLRNRYRPQE